MNKKLPLTTHTMLWKPRRPTQSAALTVSVQPGATEPVAADKKMKTFNNNINEYNRHPTTPPVGGA